MELYTRTTTHYSHFSIEALQQLDAFQSHELEMCEPTIESAREHMMDVQKHMDDPETAMLVKVEITYRITQADPDLYHLIPQD